MSRQIGEMPTKSFKPGEFIFREGDDAKGEAFMVQDGKVEIRRHFGAEDRVLRVLGKGDLLGELALFRNNAPRSANAVAAEPVTLLLIPSNRLEHLVRSNPALAIAIIKQLATRMLEAEDRARAAEERARAAEERARAAEDKLKGGA
ncbi:MAG TPA: cyclic nucleotide-binding domain-containing protein [Methylomirabilota bacterium]